MLRYKDKNGIVSPLTQYKDLYIEKVLDYGDKTLGFSADQSVVDKIQLEDYIITKTDEYVIKQINDSDNNFYDIVAKLNIDALEGNALQKFETVEQTALITANLALAGTGWRCECDIKKKRTIRMTNISSWDVLKKIADTFRLEMIVDSLDKKIIFKEKIGEDKGCYFTDQLNLISLSSQSDTTDFYTRILPLGKDGMTIESVNDGSMYLENHTYSDKNKTYIWKDERYTVPESLKEDAKSKLEELACPYTAYTCKLLDLDNECNIGDVITIIDKQKHTRIKQRIVKMKRYPDKPAEDTCEISNLKLTFSSYVKKYNNTSDTVDNITNDNGTIDGDCIDNIDASKVLNIDTVIANNAEFKSTKTDVLEVTNKMTAAEARIGKLETNSLTSESAELLYAKIEDLNGVRAAFQELKTVDFEAVKGNVKDLNVDVEKVNTLLFGSATGTTITTDFANSVASVIGSAQITSAMIKDLAFSKLTGVDINTTNLLIHSDDGKSQWKDNTIQISDKNRVRVQIGKDASGDYNIYIWDVNGNLMFDPLYGVQEDGIKKAIIRNDMVSDNANISGSKLDIDSVFSAMNADNSNTFNASKIHVDTTNQTLESTFQTINSYVDGGSDAWGSAMLQAKTFIEHKLWWTDIDAEGNSINSKFSDVKQTLDSFKISMSDVSKRLDGTFEQYEVSEAPTLDNYPATDFFVPVYPADDWYPEPTDTWQFMQEEYANHAGAVAYYKAANRTWRFLKQANGEYGWTEVSTSETAYMLNKYATFQVLIDGLSSEVGNVKVDIKDNYSTTESVKSLIKQSADSLSTTISKTYTSTTDFNEAVKDVKSYADTAAGSAQTGAEATASAALTEALKNYTITKDMTSAIEQSAEKVKAYVSETYKRAGGDFNTYEVSEVPTLDNYPATDFFVPVYPDDDWYPVETDTWQFTQEEYANHAGAIAYNPNNKQTWRFIRKNDSWQWEEISNTETAYMLNRFAQHDVAVDNITGELTSVRKDLSNNYSTTTEMVNKIIQEIKDDKSSITASLQATYATQKYADDAAGTATTNATSYTDTALKNYSTTSDIIESISPGQTSITAAVKAKLGDYATSASLTAFIENKDGQLKSAIEAIADTINITARGGLNLSGDRFTLNSTNTNINADGTITCKKLIGEGGTIGGWKIDNDSISTVIKDNAESYLISLKTETDKDLYIFEVLRADGEEGYDRSNPRWALDKTGKMRAGNAEILGGHINIHSSDNTGYIVADSICARDKIYIGPQNTYKETEAGARIEASNQDLCFCASPEQLYYLRLGVDYVNITTVKNGWHFGPDGGGNIDLGTIDHKWDNIYARSCFIDDYYYIKNAAGDYVELSAWIDSKISRVVSYLKEIVLS